MRKTPKKVRTAITQLERLNQKYDIKEADEVAKMSATEQKSHAAHLATLEAFVTDDTNFDFTGLEEAITRAFWRTEYIKRKFFVETQNSEISAKKHPVFYALAEWRKRREERIKKGTIPQDCPLDSCFYSETAPGSPASPPFPFFYNSNCPECEFKSAVKVAITAIHNVKRLGQEALVPIVQASNNITNQKWSLEFTILVSRLHALSYKYGLFAQDLFALASPEEILTGTPIRPCEEFLKRDEGDLVPKWMKITTNPPPEVNITLGDIIALTNKYELNIGISLRATDTNTNEAARAIKSQLQNFIDGLECPDFPSPSDSIIFSFDPSDASFSLKEAIETVRTSIASYHTAAGGMDFLDADYQYQAYEKYQRITGVKNYQEAFHKRAIGLYVWDKTHLLSMPCNDVIHELVESALYEEAMEFDENEIQIRKTTAEKNAYAEARKGLAPTENKPPRKNQFVKSSQHDYNEVYRLYEHARECIQSGALLTGSECERRLTRKRKEN